MSEISQSGKERDLSFDAFRGIAIIAVVAIHAIPWRLYTNYAFLSYRQLLNFAVPAFLFISGYWLSKKPVNSLENYKSFLQKRFLRILIPYFFWSLIYMGREIIKTHNFSIADAAYKLLTGGASIHFYFIIVIAQLYLLTPLLQYINRKSYGVSVVLALNMVGLFILYFLCLCNILPVADLYFILRTSFVLWIIFFEIGLLMGNRNSRISVPQDFYPLLLFAVIISLALSALEAAFMLSHYGDWLTAIDTLKYSSFIYSIVIIFVFLAARERFRNWPLLLITLGKYSFGIYLMHMIILRPVVNILSRFHAIYSYQVLYELLAVSVTLITCYALINISRKILPAPVCSKVLGF